MKAVVRVTTFLVKDKAVYQIERIVSRRANRSFALNFKRPALTEPCRLRRVFEALGKEAE
jgi:hypothetical protein